MKKTIGIVRVARFSAAVQAALDPADPKPFATEFRHLKGGGEVRWVEAHALTHFEGVSPERRAVSMVGTAQDITERSFGATLASIHDSIFGIQRGIARFVAAGGGLVSAPHEVLDCPAGCRAQHTSLAAVKPTGLRATSRRASLTQRRSSAACNAPPAVAPTCRRCRFDLNIA
jgi:hypothetical protein